jgi:hypothetical protein
MNNLLPAPTLQPTSPHSTDPRDNRRFAYPVTAYKRGLEDAQYCHQYCNPFGAGSAAQRQYDRGFEDGRATVRGG